MFTERQYQIITILSNTDYWITGAALAEMIGVSSRTLQTEIKHINETIHQENMPDKVGIISNNRLGYCLEDDENILQH